MDQANNNRSSSMTSEQEETSSRPQEETIINNKPLDLEPVEKLSSSSLPTKNDDNREEETAKELDSTATTTQERRLRLQKLISRRALRTNAADKKMNDSDAVTTSQKSRQSQQESSCSQEELQQQQKRQPYAPRLNRLGQDLTPQIVMFRKLERQAKDDECVATTTTTDEATEGATDADDQRRGEAATPTLLTDSRAPAANHSPAKQFAHHLIREITDFHKVWSYLFILFLLARPLWTAVAVVLGIVVATTIYSVFTIVKAFTKDRDFKATLKRLYSLLLEQYTSFCIDGEGRYQFVMAMGVMMDPRAHRMAQDQVNRRTPKFSPTGMLNK